jgi:hypothetical protein
MMSFNAQSNALRDHEPAIAVRSTGFSRSRGRADFGRARDGLEPVRRTKVQFMGSVRCWVAVRSRIGCGLRPCRWADEQQWYHPWSGDGKLRRA